MRKRGRSIRACVRHSVHDMRCTWAARRGCRDGKRGGASVDNDLKALRVDMDDSRVIRVGGALEGAADGGQAASDRGAIRGPRSGRTQLLHVGHYGRWLSQEEVDQRHAAHGEKRQPSEERGLPWRSAPAAPLHQRLVVALQRDRHLARRRGRSRPPSSEVLHS